MQKRKSKSKEYIKIIDGKQVLVKRCIDCGIIKELTKFTFQNKKAGTYRSTCRECRSHYEKNIRANYTYEKKLDIKLYYISKNYGISLEEANQLIIDSNNQCNICNTELNTLRDIKIDHDHTTGEVRGILCQHCNFVLGIHENNPNWFDKFNINFKKYLKE